MILKFNVKGTHIEFLFYFSDAIKWGIPMLLHQMGNTHAIAPKENKLMKGWDEI